MTKQLITLTDPASPAAEAYRSLYINLTFSGQEQPIRSLLVTSPGSEEDKSLTLANLAVVAAQMGRQVILADCDLRQPQQHTLFNLGNRVGVGNLGDEAIDLATALQPVAEVANLRVLTSGRQPPSSAQVLASRRMEELLAEMRGQADLLLLDAPPVVAVTDAAVLATRVDGVLLVLSAGHTKREQARRAKEQLAKVNANVVGAVLNNVAPDAAMQGYGS